MPTTEMTALVKNVVKNPWKISQLHGKPTGITHLKHKKEDGFNGIEFETILRKRQRMAFIETYVDEDVGSSTTGFEIKVSIDAVVTAKPYPSCTCRKEEISIS